MKGLGKREENTIEAKREWIDFSEKKSHTRDVYVPKSKRHDDGGGRQDINKISPY